MGPTPTYSYSACGGRAVACDRETGIIRVDKVWIAHDVGRSINPLLVIGQVEGSVYMGLGEALMEEQVFRKGLHKIPSMLDYKSPTTLEMPPVESILVETLDPEGPYGAKECGQGPLLPVIPAVANAVYDALGVRIDEVPITPEKVLAALDGRYRAPRCRRSRIPETVSVPPLEPAARRARAAPENALMLRLPPFRYVAPRDRARGRAPARRSRPRRHGRGRRHRPLPEHEAPAVHAARCWSACAASRARTRHRRERRPDAWARSRR